MIQQKKFLDCQTLPEKYFGLPKFLIRRYQILEMEGRSPLPPPVSYAYGFIFLLLDKQLDWLCKQK